MYEIIELSKINDPYVRLMASKQMCPCRVKDDIPEFYERLFDMATDQSKEVRYQVMHNMCDGSPPQYEDRVMACIELFNRDKDNKIRSKASKILSSYRFKGKWNIM